MVSPELMQGMPPKGTFQVCLPKLRARVIRSGAKTTCSRFQRKTPPRLSLVRVTPTGKVSPSFSTLAVVDAVISS